MLHEIGHTFGLDDCMDCAQGSTVMSTYRTDCFCEFYPCDQQVPFNGMRWGCHPLTEPRDCEVAAVASRAGLPNAHANSDANPGSIPMSKSFSEVYRATAFWWLVLWAD